MSRNAILSSNNFATPQRKLENSRAKRKLSENKAHSAFKSPVHQHDTALKTNNQDDNIALLEEREKIIEKEISELEKLGYHENELQTHIEILHEYNDIKDTAQRLIGLLAVQKNVTTRELYPSFNLDLND